METILTLKIIRILLINISILSLLSGFISAEENRNEENDYAIFYYSQFFKDYPGGYKNITKKTCKARKTAECRYYSILLKHKNKIITRYKGTALDNTLNIIKNKCNKISKKRINKIDLNNNNYDPQLSNCMGPVLFLYFFDSKKDDLKLIDFFKLNHHILEKSFLTRLPPIRVVLKNRPNKYEWNSLVKTICNISLNECPKYEFSNPKITQIVFENILKE